MGPVLGRIAFHLGILVFILALIPLPFLSVGSAEFVVDVIALGLSGTFLALVAWSVRRAARLPGNKEGERRGPEENQGGS